MAGPSALRRLRSRQRIRARRLGRQRRGVAAVIGTLLALLVFMTLFGIFLTQFLPIWMTDNEAAEADTVAGQIGQIKSCMDDLALSQEKGPICSTPLTMESQGIPIFGTPTQATLNFQQVPQLFANVSFNATGVIGGRGPCPPCIPDFYLNGTPAQMSVILPDRYYVPVTYSLTLGSVVASQGGTAQTMLFPPGIIGSNQSTQTTLTMTLYEMYGQLTSITGVASSEVYVSYLTSQNYTGTNTAVNMTLTTQYPCAWQQFYGTGFKGTLISPEYAPANCPSNVRPGAFYLMHCYFPTVTYFYITVVYFDVEMGPGNPT